MTDLTQPVPRVVKLTVARKGGHAYVKVWIGQEPHPGCCGQLVMRREDWADFTDGGRRFWPEQITYVGDAEAWLNPPMVPPQPDALALLVDGHVWTRHTLGGDPIYRSEGSDHTYTWAGLWEFAAGEPIVPLVPQCGTLTPEFPFRVQDFDGDAITVEASAAGSGAAAHIKSSLHVDLTAGQCRDLGNALLWLADRHDAKAGA